MGFAKSMIWRRRLAACVIVAFVLSGQGSALALQHTLGRLPSPQESGSPPSAPKVDVELFYAQALGLRDSANPRVAARARWVISRYEIHKASSPSERHEKIRALAVSIVRSPPSNGFVTVRFVAKGKTRFTLSVPAVSSSNSSAGGESGPFVSAGDDDCYDGPPPCVTEQEMEDLLILVADGEAELDDWQDEVDDGLNDYCNQYPSECEDSSLKASGPSSFENCWSKAMQATVALAGAWASYVYYANEINTFLAMGYRLTTQGYVVYTTIIFSVAFFAGVYTAAAIDCFWSVEPAMEVTTAPTVEGSSCADPRLVGVLH